MRLLIDSCWRAAAYCLHPRVIALSVLPLALMVAAVLLLGRFYWEDAIDAVRQTLESWALLTAVVQWLDGIGLTGFKVVLAPLIVVFVSIPVIVLLSLLLVAAFMTPWMLGLVADRRFPTLEKRRGGSFVGSMAGAAWATLVALIALLLSVPLWLVPPLVLIVPPLIWGWLTYRVMTYDVLSDHASRDERHALLREHRFPLLTIGVMTGYLGAAPSLIWVVSGVMAIALAPVLVPIAIWIYTLVFAFSSLWFAHYALSALSQQRARHQPVVVDAEPLPEPSINAREIRVLPAPDANPRT